MWSKRCKDGIPPGPMVSQVERFLCIGLILGATVARASNEDGCNEFSSATTRLRTEVSIQSKVKPTEAFFRKAVSVASENGPVPATTIAVLNGTLAATFCLPSFEPTKAIRIQVGPKSIVIPPERLINAGVSPIGRQLFNAVPSEPLAISWISAAASAVAAERQVRTAKVRIRFENPNGVNEPVGPILVRLEGVKSVCRADSPQIPDSQRSRRPVDVFASVNGKPLRRRDGVFFKGEHCGMAAAITFAIDAQELPPGFTPQVDLDFDLLAVATGNNSETIRSLLDHVQPSASPRASVRISFPAGRVFPEALGPEGPL